jgi:hypothetical protein
MPSESQAEDAELDKILKTFAGSLLVNTLEEDEKKQEIKVDELAAYARRRLLAWRDRTRPQPITGSAGNGGNAELDEILEDVANAWCDTDCGHPRCAGKKQAARKALLAWRTKTTTPVTDLVTTGAEASTGDSNQPTQKDVINFVTNPKTIAKATEGSMDKRNAVLNPSKGIESNTFNPIPPESCICASFWTVRQTHKTDCPLAAPSSGEEELASKMRKCFDNFGHDVVNFGKEEGARHSLSRKYVRYLLQEHAQQVKAAEIAAQIKVWQRLRTGDGFSRHDGCFEIHPDYIDECIEVLKAKLAAPPQKEKES